MSRTPIEVLQQVFGYAEFRGHQQLAVDELVAGKDVLILMPTGGGKSLCYQIPAIIREGVGIVISPLIALMQDQVDALEQLGVRANFLNSTLSADAVYQIEQQLLRNEIDLLYIAPERLKQPRTLGLLRQINIGLFAIDEAHCVSQWGHDFRADYLQLNMLHEQFPNVPRIALTATADERTRKEIISRLNLEHAKHLVSGFDRPNIQYRITQKNNPRQQLLRFIRREHEHDAGIVYCLSRHKVEATADWLSSQGFQALPYHAGLSPELRQHHQQRFLREEGIIIVATIAFGMGIDKPDVRFVAHLDLPKSLEAYYQETGRAGRDGQPSTAWMVYGLQDVIKLRQMLEQSQGSDEHKRVERHRLDSMLGLCEITSCRRQSLLYYFGETNTQPCGNCDTCISPKETWDGTEAARKALSCVFRTDQRFGVNHLIDVLRGESTDKVKQHGHNNVSTFGIGKDLSLAQWRSVFRQLVARGFLNVDMDAFGAIKLADACRPILRGEETLFLHYDVQEPATGRTKTKPKKSTVAAEDQALWEALRRCRKQLADEHGVPPYVVFHDATLAEMLHYRPLTNAQLLNISGVGETKLDKFGAAFIAVLQSFEEGVPATTPKNSITAANERHEIFALVNAGLNVETIAQQRSSNSSVIYKHIADLIEAGSISVETALDLPSSELAQIEDALLIQDDLTEDSFTYHRVLEDLDNRFPVGVLRCVRASILQSMA